MHNTALCGDMVIFIFSDQQAALVEQRGQRFDLYSCSPNQKFPTLIHFALLFQRSQNPLHHNTFGLMCLAW